ncbi:MAG: hypothetical protein AAF558_02350 [Verrucomicrobiota bacterium]
MTTIIATDIRANKLNHNIFFGKANDGIKYSITDEGTVAARADSSGPLSGALVRSGSLPDGTCGIVSGLTSCIGVIIAIQSAGLSRFNYIVVAHFNGGYDDQASWDRIDQALNGHTGRRYGLVIMTKDTTDYGRGSALDYILPMLSNRNVQDQNTLIYHNKVTSGVAFGVKSDGSVGEVSNQIYTT